MKRFDLSEIMRTAHRTYKYSGKKQGKSFAEVLRQTWKLAKLHVSIEESLKAQSEQRKIESQKMAEIKTTTIEYKMPKAMTSDILYPHNNRGYMGAKFVGD